MDNKDTPQKADPEALTEKMRQWRKANPQATLTEIEEAVEAGLAQLRRQLVEEMVKEEAAELDGEPACPHCGEKMVKNGQRQRKLQSKEGQTIHLKRQQWRCLSCGATLFPLDRALGLLRGAYTPQVQEAITRLSSRMTYREAQEELMLLWKVAVSKGSLQNVTMRRGQVADRLVKEKAAQLEATAPVPLAQPEQLVMCTDGAMGQLTSGDWREVKTVTFGEFRPHWDAKQGKVVTRTDQISYFSRVETAEAIELAIRYLEKRLPMIDYPHFRRQQIPIGSGNVESGHKVVMQQRMKQAGMRWAERNLNPMLALRVALCNQRWKMSWQASEARVRQDKFPVNTPRKRPSQRPTEPTVVTEADCQRLETLANRIVVKKKRLPWQDHRWLFPYRDYPLHQN